LPTTGGTICLATNNCGFTTGTNFWQAAGTGAITTNNTTFDVLLGATSTSSAKFGFLNNAGGTPTASISANTAGNATFVTGTGTIGTTNGQSLTVGTSGNVNFFNANNAITSAGNLTLNGTTITAPNLTTLTSSASLSLPSTTTLSLGASAAINPASGTLSLGTANTSALSLGNGTDTTTFNGTGTFSANSTLYQFGNGSSSTIETTTNGSLTLQPGTATSGTGNITLAADYNSSVFVGSATTPAPLSISGGIGNNGALIINNTNSGDLIDASASGTTKFQVTTAGDILGGKINGLTITNNGTNTLNIAAGKTLTVSNSITFTGTDTTSFALPTASDTLAGLAATQTLTNKTLDNTNQITLKDSKFTLQNAADTSKQLAF